MGMFGALSNQGLGIMPGDMPDTSQRPFPLDASRHKPGVFGQGGVGRTILGILGDALAASNGMSPVFTGTKIQDRQRTLSLEDEQRKRQQDLEDAVALTQAKAQFREPSELEQKVLYLNKLKPGLGDEYASNFAQGPPMAVDVANPDGSVIRQYMTRQAAPTQPGPPQMPGNIPTGSPLRGPANSKVIIGPKGPMQVWLVNGEWYDNPEGR